MPFSTSKIFGATIRESATDGSDFTNPDADYRRLFLGEDGLLHVKDSAGAVTAPYTSGSAADKYFSRRILATVDNANVTWNVNNGTGAYIAFGVTQFYHDWDIFPATHFLITGFCGSSEAAQTVSLQLTPSASPTNPVSAAGGDLVLTNTVTNRSSGWIAVSDAMSGLTLMCLAGLGSNTTVDFSGRWLDIAMKVDV